MAVILLKAIFLVITTLSNLISWVIFTGVAHVSVQLIQALKVQAEGSQRILEQVRNVIGACLDYLLDFIVEAISTLVSSIFDLLKEGVFSTSAGLVGGVLGLLEKSKTSLDGVVEDVPEAVNAFAEMVGKIVTDFLSNCNDAMTYFSENILK